MRARDAGADQALTQKRPLSQMAWVRGLFALAAFLGAGSAAWLVWQSGWGAILASLERGGAGLLWLIPLRVATVGSDARGWHGLLRASRQARWSLLLWLGMVRDAVNTFLPVARVGGELVAIRLLRVKGVKVSTASASVIVETSVTLVLQVFLTLSGIIAILPNVGAAFLVPELFGVLGFAIVVLAVFLMVQIRVGLVAAFDRTLGRVFRGLGYSGGRFFVNLDQKVLILYRRRDLLLRCAAWQLVAFGGGLAEIFLMAHLMRIPLDLRQSFILESLIQAIHSVSFVVPGSLGIQEAGLVLLGGPLGLSMEAMLSLALARRLRQVAIGLPILGSWQWFEWRHRRRARELPLVSTG